MHCAKGFSITDYLLEQKVSTYEWTNIIEYNIIYKFYDCDYFNDIIIILKYLKKKNVDLSEFREMVEGNDFDFDYKTQLLTLIEN